MKTCRLVFSRLGLVVVSALAPATLLAEEPISLVLSCREDNDLYRVLRENGVGCLRRDKPGEAVREAPAGSGVLVLADDYPACTTAVFASAFKAAAAKSLRLYLEYPAWLPGMEVGGARRTSWERVVVASDAFGPALGKMRIVAVHDCHFVPFKAEAADLVAARVAGFDIAVFGLPKETFPILFLHPRGDVMVATTKLSQFVTARYAPTDAWKIIWNRILSWLQQDKTVPDLKWKPTVRPSFGRDDPLPDDVEKLAFRRGVEWFKRSGLLATGESTGGRAGLAAPGSGGIGEGYRSVIRFDGTQPTADTRRSDCNGESSMALAFGGEFLGDAFSKNAAANVADWLYTRSTNARGSRVDPESPSYGLLSWSWDSSGVYYSDDNARCMLGTMACAALLKTDRWDEPLIRCLTANLRLCGRDGFQRGRVDDNNLQNDGWRHYYNRPLKIEYGPHYVSWIWACYLWTYRHTGYQPFLDQARKGLTKMMEAYPDKWEWTNGLQQERARLVLPLAWLLRVEDTPEHREWLRRIAGDMLKHQVACGAIREELGKPGKGSYPPPASNEEFGTTEAPLIQQNGDPVCDLLYTTNFAMFSLHEAAAASGERFLIDAEEKLAKFLCRIQVRSEAHPVLDGAWFRGFDFNRWEHWASNADAGWGAWSIETGWTQAWISSVLAMREMKTSFWDLTRDSGIARHFEHYRQLMLPGENTKPAQ